MIERDSESDGTVLVLGPFFGPKGEPPPLGAGEADVRVEVVASPFDALLALSRREGRRPSGLLWSIGEWGPAERSFLEALRGGHPSIRIVALVAPTLAECEGELRERGANAVLLRPAPDDELRRALGLRPLPPRKRSGDDAGKTSSALREDERAAASEPARDRALREAFDYLSRHLDDAEALVEGVLNLGLSLVRASRGSVMLIDERTNTLAIHRAVGIPEDVRREQRVKLGEGIAGLVARSGAPLLVRDVDDEPIFRALNGDRGYRTASFVSVPLRSLSGVLGVLNVADRDDGAPFGDDDLEALLSLATLAARAIQNARQLEKMEALSMVDELTGLYNRRFFDRGIETEITRARRYKRHLTLAILDVDHFKRYNDDNGYLLGDEVLKGVARLIRANFRKTDVVARWGGEEFAVILPESAKGEAGDGGALHFAERVRRAVEEHAFPKCETMPSGRITLSGGVAEFPADAATPHELLSRANHALKHAKRHGRNRIVVFTPDL
jgi:diguanylate cyclase (GGDEF)-like protein